MTELLIRTGKYRGNKIPLPAKSFTIGRDDACNLRIASNDVSRRHCLFLLSERGLVVRDLSSRNGTYINDVVITEDTLLQTGDIVRIGPMEFEFIGDTVALKADETDPPGIKDSGDQIADWLSYDENGESDSQLGMGDTTIITGSNEMDTKADPLRPSEHTGASEHTSLEPAVPASLKAESQFQALAEQAAEIIREHWRRKKLEAGG